MNHKYQEYGGGPAVGLAENFTNFLNRIITTGSFGGTTAAQQANAANPIGSTQDVFGFLNSIIQGPDAGLITTINDMISKETDRSANALRARFGAQGGMAFGTPAAFAEGVLRAEAAPRAALAVDEINRANKALGIQALMPLFQMASGLSQAGIAPRQGTLQPPGWLQGVNLLLDVANTAANFIPFGGGGATNRTVNSTTVLPSSALG